MSKQDRVTVVAEMPEEMLEKWRLFVVLNGGKVIAPVDRDEIEQYRRKIQHYERVLSEQAEQRQSYVDRIVERLEVLHEIVRIDQKLAVSQAIEIVKGGGRDETD